MNVAVTDFIPCLPEELSLAIFAQLPPKDLASSNGVSKEWYRLSNDPTLWSPIFANLNQEIKTKEDAQLFCANTSTVKTIQELKEKIKEIFQKCMQTQESFAIRYRPVSNPNAFWITSVYRQADSQVERPEDIFYSASLKYTIKGTDQADISRVQKHAFSVTRPYIKETGVLYKTEVLYFFEEMKECDKNLTSEIYTESITPSLNT